MAQVPGVVDVRMQQVSRTPDIRVAVDRTLANLVGLSQGDVASSMLISLSSSNQTAPNYWLNPANGVNYSVYVQTPQYHMDSVNDLENTPIVPAKAGAGFDADKTQLLGNLAAVGRGSSPTNITHININPSYDVLLSVERADLGSVSQAVAKIAEEYRAQLPRGSRMAIRGQVESMQNSFTGLVFGLIFAVLLVYLLMVVNFQSWLDPLIILMALPGAAAGILWILWATQTTISVPVLMGGDHEHRRGHRKQYPHDHLRQRPAQTGKQRPRCSPGGRSDAVASGGDDRAGDDHRHAADVVGTGRGR